LVLKEKKKNKNTKFKILIVKKTVNDLEKHKNKNTSELFGRHDFLSSIETQKKTLSNHPI